MNYKRSIPYGSPRLSNPLVAGSNPAGCAALNGGSSRASRTSQLALFLRPDRGERDETGDDDGDEHDAAEHLEHDEGAGEGLERDDIAEADAGENGEAEEEELEPAPGVLGVLRGGKAAWHPGLADTEGEGERPGEQRESGAGGDKFVKGDAVIPQHVENQSHGRIEVQERLQEVADGKNAGLIPHMPDKGEDDGGDGEEPANPVDEGIPVHNPQRKGEHKIPEEHIGHATSDGPLHEGIKEDGQKLGGEQPARRLPAQRGIKAELVHAGVKGWAGSLPHAL